MAQTQAAQPAQVPPHTPKKSNVVDNYKTLSGFEGREEQLGKSLNVMLKTLSNTAGYAHEINDALVKMHLNAMQFAKDQGKIDEWVEHDVKTMRPINSRMANIIKKTGQKEIALVGLFDRTACHYQLAMENESDEGMRRWKLAVTMSVSFATVSWMRLDAAAVPPSTARKALVMATAILLSS